MFIGTQCDLWGRPDGTGHEKISRGKFPRLIFRALYRPEGEKLIRYQLSIDGKRENTEKYKSGESEIKISSIQDGMLHNIKIIDFASGLVKYEYAYAVLPNAKLTFNRPIYCSEEIEVEIIADVDGRNIRLSLCSPGAEVIVEEERNKAIDEQLLLIRKLAPDIAIIEQ